MSAKILKNQFLQKNGAWIGFFLLALALTILTQGGFVQPRNLTNLLRQTSINGILAAGMTLVILLGGIDLSIGSLVALSGVVVGISQVFWGWGASTAGALEPIVTGKLVRYPLQLLKEQPDYQ